MKPKRAIGYHCLGIILVSTQLHNYNNEVLKHETNSLLTQFFPVFIKMSVVIILRICNPEVQIDDHIYAEDILCSIDCFNLGSLKYQLLILKPYLVLITLFVNDLAK